MLFLGAGASKAVGLPTLPELTQEIRKAFNNPFEPLDKLLAEPSDINYPENELDLEIYITIIDSLTETSQSIIELNYDLVLENYANETEKDYLTQRGFQKIPRGIGDYLDIVSLRSSCPNYLKLHGSLDWCKRSDGRIVISNTGKKLYGRELVEHLMIYPIYEKYISLEPFYSLYSAFRKRLWEELVLVVIGYSFRDISVNNAFADFLRFNKSARIIISTKSKPVKDRINKTFNFSRNIVQLIETYFGEKDFSITLRNALTRDCRLNSGSV